MRTTAMRSATATSAIAIMCLLGSCADDGEAGLDLQSPTQSVSTSVSDSDWGYDINNKYMVAGAADSVIVGTVLSQVSPSQSRQEPIPETQFVVRVDESLKGEASGEIVVSQLGGLLPDGKTIVLSGEDSLMQPTSSYVMALVFDPATKWYTATPATNGIFVVERDDGSNTTQQRGGGGEPEAVTSMRDAIANEQEPQPDEQQPLPDK